MHVLLVEDDPEIAEPLARGLARYGHDVHWVATGQEALLAGGDPEMVLLDLGLPDMEGLDVCRRLRARSEVSLIMISARGSETDKVVGLELGADDYVVKPFTVRELIARMRAVQRRRLAPPPAAVVPRQAAAGVPGVVIGLPRRSLDRYGRLSIDRLAHRTYLDDTEILLSPKEYALLVYLADRLDTLATREDIMAAVWDSNWFGPTKTLDTHVYGLRHKLGDAVCIEAVRGVGFRLAVKTGTPAHQPAS
ncbi:DNA-binding response regulator [Streptomyces sp. V2]|uniref:Response regulator transcription factor n=1 Tax=Streptomyces niveiscabiei TaxID=164115 RepID=A0ABW9HRE5_9ACTN|nr:MULTISPECIES: response regulator transcription factor [Streptomyces]PWG14823.1 DNA-binding response regulator [Streptomyces sp. V2]QZZ31709.1 response regulator transcription factor [Streptomyces sp. ST1015]